MNATAMRPEDTETRGAIPSVSPRYAKMSRNRRNSLKINLGGHFYSTQKAPTVTLALNAIWGFGRYRQVARLRIKMPR
jgi:hypothetical protein